MDHLKNNGEQEMTARRVSLNGVDGRQHGTSQE
jgi:hypothetical protein